MLYTVKYSAGPYSGTRQVNADDKEEAIRKVRAMIRRDMTLPMYSDSYKVINVSDNDDEEDE